MRLVIHFRMVQVKRLWLFPECDGGHSMCSGSRIEFDKKPFCRGQIEILIFKDQSFSVHKGCSWSDPTWDLFVIICPIFLSFISQICTNKKTISFFFSDHKMNPSSFALTKMKCTFLFGPSNILCPLVNFVSLTVQRYFVDKHDSFLSNGKRTI